MVDDAEEGLSEISRPYKDEEKKPGSWRIYLVMLCFIAIVPVGLAVWNSVSDRYFENNGPLLTITEKPEGMGAGISRLGFTLFDEGAGLDEVVVRLRPRKGPPKDIFKKEYKGRKEAQELVEFNAADLGLDPGPVTIAIRAFDRSVWSNTSEASINERVDFKKPHAEVVSVMHNAHVGGSQLCFYRAYDEDFAASGVKVGEQSFRGYPASALDKEFDDPTLRVALYAIDMRPPDKEPAAKDQPINVFSQDSVKNLFLGKFYNTVKPRRLRPVVVNVSEDEIEPLVLNNFAEAANTSQTQSSWILPFLIPRGSINLNFGDELIYKKNGVEIKRELVTGYLFKLPPNDRNVIAANDGTVLFVGKSRKIGSFVMIDHGLGLVSVYDRLKSVSVKLGDPITRGQLVGSGAQSPNAKVPDFYFELRAQGIPVDPREWWDARWCNDHITKKIKDVKKTLGMSAPTPGES